MDRTRLDLETYYQSLGLEGKVLEDKINEGLSRVESGYPLAYLVKEAYFYDLVFTVDERVLIPRFDTERLCEKAIAILPKGARFVDFGTGSGCIAVTILYHRPDLTAVAVDLSSDALEVAAHNAHRYGVEDRLTLVEGDMTKSLCVAGNFDLVISNPPYIPTCDIAAYPTLCHEPYMALDGGEDGLDFYRALLLTHKERLKQNGGFLFEIGFDQGKAMQKLAEENSFSAEIYKDYGKNDRVALLYPLTFTKGTDHENSGI